MEEHFIWQAHRLGGVHFGVYVSRIMPPGKEEEEKSEGEETE